MFETLDNAFDAFGDLTEPCAAFATLALSFGQTKILVEGEGVPAAHEVKDYLAKNGIRADVYPLSGSRLVVAVAGADVQRTRALLENLCGGDEP